MFSIDKHISLYEAKVTGIAALINGYVKDAGGVTTEIGHRFSWVLHEYVGNSGHALKLINILKRRIALLERERVVSTPDIDRQALAEKIAEFRIAQTGTTDGWTEITAADEALVDEIIRSGWVAPTLAVQLPVAVDIVDVQD